MIILTPTEYKNAKSKVKQIEEFIKTEILPYIYDSYKISFGTERNRYGELHLSLCVDGITKDIWGFTGHLLICFNKDDVPKESGKGVYIYDSWNYGGDFCYNLIADWTRIKKELFALIAKAHKEEFERKMVLQNFEI